MFAALWLAPLELDAPAHRLAAIMGAVIVLWVTEAIPMAMTAFLGVAGAVALGVAPAAVAFAPFADPLIFLFVGTFMLAQSIFFHGLDRRFAFAILSLPGVGDRPGRVLVAYAAVACAISMWISNTATTAMMFPIGVSLLAALEARSDGAALPAGFGTALLLSNSFAASVGGLGTPVGTPPNLIGIGFIRRELGVELPFFSWMALGVPLVLALLAFLLFDLARSGAPAGTRLVGVTELLGRERAQARRLVARREEHPVRLRRDGVLLGAAGRWSRWSRARTRRPTASCRRALPESVVALFGAALLFVLPTNLARHEFTLPWREAVKIDWWIVFLYGGGIALGTLAFKTGLADALGRSLTSLLGLHSSLGLIALSTALAAVLSETTSNTAAANMVVPVTIAVARSAGLDPVLPALAATMGASLGFMLPVSTPCNAIVYGSGRIPLTRMMRHGVVLDLAGIVLIVGVVSLLGPWVLGALRSRRSRPQLVRLTRTTSQRVRNLDASYVLRRR